MSSVEVVGDYETTSSTAADGVVHFDGIVRVDGTVQVTGDRITRRLDATGHLSALLRPGPVRVSVEIRGYE